MNNNDDRLLQEWVESDIIRATSSRTCPATAKECYIPDHEGAKALRSWFDYIERCAKTNSSDIFSVADRQNVFVACCKDCDIYKHYIYLQNLQKRQQTHQKVASKRVFSLLQALQTAWKNMLKSRRR